MLLILQINLDHNLIQQPQGILQSLREVPGFLAFGVVFVLLLLREQSLALLALLLLGVGTALTGFFPSVGSAS